MRYTGDLFHGTYDAAPLLALVGQVGLEPTTVRDTEFMAPETRIELETYDFENLGYLNLVQFLK